MRLYACAPSEGQIYFQMKNKFIHLIAKIKPVIYDFTKVFVGLSSNMVSQFDFNFTFVFDVLNVTRIRCINGRALNIKLAFHMHECTQQ